MKKIVNSDKGFNEFLDQAYALYKEHKYLRVDIKTGKQRTLTQNACLHKYCTEVAECLNDQGITFNDFFKEGIEVPWTMEIVKDNIWRPVQKAITGHESTTKPVTTDYNKIYEVINRKLSEYGFHIAWPSKESMKDDK